MALIKGILKNASGVRPNTKIILIAQKTTFSVIQHAPDLTIITDENGAYSFECNPSTYLVVIMQTGNAREQVGTIEVYSDSVSGSINDFLTQLKPEELTPELIHKVESLRNEAQEAADESKSYSDLSAELLAKSVISADKAQSAADAAAASGKIYSTIAQGIAATTNGELFLVVSDKESGFSDLYLNDNGTGVYQGKTTQSVLDIGFTGIKNLIDKNSEIHKEVGVVGNSYGYNPAVDSRWVRVEANQKIIMSHPDTVGFFTSTPSNSTMICNAGTIAQRVLDPVTNKYHYTCTAPSNAVMISYAQRWFTDIDFMSIYYAPYTTESIPPFESVVYAINSSVTLPPSVSDAIDSSVRMAITGDANLYNSNNNCVDMYISGYSFSYRSGVGSVVTSLPISTGKKYYMYANGDTHFSGVVIAFGPRGGTVINQNILALGVLALTGDATIRSFTVPDIDEITTAYITIKWDSSDFTSGLVISSERNLDKNSKYVQSTAVINDASLIDNRARYLIENAVGNIKKSRYQDQKIYIFGDSITQGGAVGSYGDIVADITGAIVPNVSSGGAGAERLVGMMTDIPSRDPATPFEGKDPDYSDVPLVAIMIGTNLAVDSMGSLNDIPTSGSVFDLPEGFATVKDYLSSYPNTYYGNLAICIEHVKYKNPTAKILLIAPIWNNRRDNNELTYAATKEIADFYSIKWINARDRSGLSKKMIMYYTYDGTHLSATGRDVLGNYIGAKIASI